MKNSFGQHEKGCFSEIFSRFQVEPFLGAFLVDMCGQVLGMPESSEKSRPPVPPNNESLKQQTLKQW